MSKLKGKRILITSGPTQEPIDPVRFISNYSSGKMGLAVANAAVARGAAVQMVSGPVDYSFDKVAFEVTNVKTAAEMYAAVAQYFSDFDVIIFAAAVADYTPKTVAPDKIKKAGDTLTLELIKTKDIAFEMGKRKTANQICVGFALETNSEEDNAIGKLKKKNFDLIVLNSMNDAGAGFQHDTNKITIFDKHELQAVFELKSKNEVAEDILNHIEQLL